MLHVRTGQRIILTYFLLFTDLLQHMCQDEVPCLNGGKMLRFRKMLNYVFRVLKFYVVRLKKIVKNVNNICKCYVKKY